MGLANLIQIVQIPVCPDELYLERTFSEDRCPYGEAMGASAVTGELYLFGYQTL